MDSLDPARLRAVVKEAIDQADPIGLLEIGCPGDEYDPEIDRVLAHVLEYSDPGGLGERIHQVFIEMFDERIAGPLEVYDRIARRIVEAMREEGVENGSWEVDR